MNIPAFRAIILVVATVALIVLGGFAVFRLSGSKNLIGQFRAQGDAKPLYLRFGGYDSEAVIRHWGLHDDNARMIEQRLLKWDLLFPFWYGAVLATSLLLTWECLDRPFPMLWLLLPVAVAMVADWTENTVQLRQLEGFIRNGEAGLKTGWIQLASAATVAKLVSFVGSLLLLMFLTGWNLWIHFRK